VTSRLSALVSALVVTACLLAPKASPQAAEFDLQTHRGGRGETTEESLRAFAKSLELGVSTLELDINITKDGQPLVWHDSTIEPEKCSDTAPAYPGDPEYPYVGKLVQDLTLAQIRMLECGRRLGDFPDAEVVRGNIETKVAADKTGTTAGPQQFVDVILAAVRSAGKIDRVEIQSFDWRTLPLVRRAEPSIPLAALWDEQTWFPDSPWLAGVNPTVVGSPLIAATLVGASIASPDYSLVDKAFVDTAHALGLKVIPWTVNDAGAMREQIADGVDGIITDYPTRLRSVLGELGMPLPPAYHRG